MSVKTDTGDARSFPTGAVEAGNTISAKSDGLPRAMMSSAAGSRWAEGLDNRYVRHLLPLASLTPESVEAVLAEAQFPKLSVETLAKRANLPRDEAKQKVLPDFK